MPVFSLPTKYGIGTLGKCAYDFIDFLEKAGQSYWQILPISPTNYGDSPYQSFSSFAGNPYFIDLDLLAQDGLLKESEYNQVDFGDNNCRIDYEKMYHNRYPVLKLAAERFFEKPDRDFDEFCEQHNSWLHTYALFMAIKDNSVGKSFLEWERPLMLREGDAIKKAAADFAEDIKFYKFLQFAFFKQWNELKEYANACGIKIIGDMPIYVAADSAEVWSEPEQFDLREDLKPRVVSGCPPDAFSEDGQLWGSPVYRWDYMKKEKNPYGWWKKRIAHALNLFDVLRIDHFRGFESFYTIPFGAEDAKKGEWVKGPGKELFDEISKELGGQLPIIAEDLGLLTESVKQMLKETGFPGMKVLQFAFGGEDSDYLLHNHTKNGIVYIGTHDNDTALGWRDSLDADDLKKVSAYINCKDQNAFNWDMIKVAMISPCDTAIFMMQDFIGLGSEGRINTPSTSGENWQWRIAEGCANDWLAGIIKDCTKTYGRLPKK